MGEPRTTKGLGLLGALRKARQMPDHEVDWAAWIAGIEAEASTATAGPGLPRYRDVLDPGNAPDKRSAGQCVEAGCFEPAGTAWSDLWCVRHNAERMDRITGALASRLAARAETE